MTSFDLQGPITPITPSQLSLSPLKRITLHLLILLFSDLGTAARSFFAADAVKVLKHKHVEWGWGGWVAAAIFSTQNEVRKQRRLHCHFSRHCQHWNYSDLCSVILAEPVTQALLARLSLSLVVPTESWDRTLVGCESFNFSFTLRVRCLYLYIVFFFLFGFLLFWIIHLHNLLISLFGWFLFSMHHQKPSRSYINRCHRRLLGIISSPFYLLQWA